MPKLLATDRATIENCASKEKNKSKNREEEYIESIDARARFPGDAHRQIGKSARERERERESVC